MKPCSPFDEAIDCSSRIAEAFKAETLEPVAILKNKLTGKFFIIDKYRPELFYSIKGEWDYRERAQAFTTQIRAEDTALDGGYFIDIKN